MKISFIARFRQDHKGAIFLGLIMVMVIFAAMGVALISMSITSTFSQVWTGSASRAYYLAESGFRYAQTEYKNASHRDLNQKLINWHSPDPPASPVLFTLVDTLGRTREKFELKIYPYFLVTSQSYNAGATTLVTKFPGEQPSGLTVPSSGKLKIGTDPIYSYTSYTHVSGTNVHTFTLSTGLVSPLLDNMDVYLVANPAESKTISKDGSLTLADAGIFPDTNGVFRVDGGDGTVYGYRSKSGTTLQGIFNVSYPDRTFSVTVAPANNIVLNPFIKLHSIGIFDYGSGVENRHEIVYNVPLTTRVEFKDTFEDKSRWDSALGSHDTPTIGTSKALKVTGTGTVGGSDVGSLAKLKWSQTNVKLNIIHNRAGNFLSYDAQVKVGFDPSIPASYMAGISFRQDAVASGNSYGVSFLKRGSSDGIPDALEPNNDFPMIVLWQQTSSGTAKKWLAHKYMVGRPVYLDTGKDGWSTWTTAQCGVTETCLSSWSGCEEPPVNYNGVLWHQTTSTYRPDRNNHTTELSYYGSDTRHDYWTGMQANCGVIKSPSVNLTSATSAYLSFWSWYQTEPNEAYDKKFVQVSTDGGSTWNTLKQILSSQGNPGNTWQQILVDLSSYAGQSIKIRFKFDTCDCASNNYYGWYIDDVVISGAFPVDQATLMVRVTEGATLKFTTSGTGNTTPIKDGDIVIQGAARGTVVGDPILESGSWAGGDAAGIMILNKVFGTFIGSQNLYVNGAVLAKTQTANFFRSRDNYIKVFYGEKDTYGTPNATPLDYEKWGYPRGADVRWPPDDVDDTAAGNDYFTLVQWDTPNTALDGTVNEGIFGKDKELDAIMRLNALTSPPSGTFSASEIGLHTFGVNSTSIYFDDFALQGPIVSTGEFLPSIQE